MTFYNSIFRHLLIFYKKKSNKCRWNAKFFFFHNYKWWLTLDMLNGRPTESFSEHFKIHWKRWCEINARLITCNLFYLLFVTKKMFTSTHGIFNIKADNCKSIKRLNSTRKKRNKKILFKMKITLFRLLEKLYCGYKCEKNILVSNNEWNYDWESFLNLLFVARCGVLAMKTRVKFKETNKYIKIEMRKRKSTWKKNWNLLRSSIKTV